MQFQGSGTTIDITVINVLKRYMYLKTYQLATLRKKRTAVARGK